MKRILLLQWLLLATVMAMAQSQDPQTQLTTLQANFDQFARNNPQERVYLHFDNTSYYKGEHIYYKAYVVDDATLKPSDMSRILYVELVNPIGYPVETQKLMVRNGQTSGSFLLKDTLNAGFYEVRAYTAWMLNFAQGNGHGWWRMTKVMSREFYGERFQHYLRGNAGIFSRVFPIYEGVGDGQYNKKSIPRIPKSTASLANGEKDKLQIDFYPEGGNLVRGVSTRVAFQAHTTEGRTLNVMGKLIRKGKEIGTFQSLHAGRGMFSFVSDESDETEDELLRSLRLEVRYEGKDYTFRLPKAQRRGYVLNVFTGKERIRAIVSRNDQTDGEQLGLSITSRGVTLHNEILDLRQKESLGIEIDKSQLQTGVNIYTLYNNKGKVIAQREVFVNNHDLDGKRLHIDLPTDSNGLKPHDKVTLQCQLVDKEGNPVHEKGKFSMAVTDGVYRDGTYADGNALSYLLLSSEVKGFIPHPEYYFEADDNEHRTALDLLLMVQGWTRYDFERMMSDEPWTPLMAVERGLNFRGRVVDDHGSYEYEFWKNLKSPMWVYDELSTPYRTFSQAEVKTDSLGFFMFNFNPFFGPCNMAFTLNEKSAEKIGHKKAGVVGHLFSVFKNKRPPYLVGKHIIPLNPYSPIARNYDYYETRALSDAFDKNLFTEGYMSNTEKVVDMLYYDDATRAFVMPEVKVQGRRGWADFRQVKPTAVIDVRDLMTHLSNVFGTINDFHFYGSGSFMGGRSGTSGDDFRLMGNDAHKGGWWHPGAERDSSIQNSFTDDSFFIDMMRYRQRADSLKPEAPSSHNFMRVNSQRMWNKYHKLSDHQFDFSFASYFNYNKLLMILGLDGMNLSLVDSPVYGTQPQFVSPDRYGLEENLAPGMSFFPPDANFSKLYLYVDADDRSLIHQEGKYRERLFHYELGGSKNSDHPLTSIINFKTEDILRPGFPQPDFYGFRINFQGYTIPDEFYCVDYSNEPLPKNGDYRRTIYWNPSVTTDGEGHAQVTFYNNSFTKNIAVSAEGLTENGIILQEK
ncbi:MAG: hypothetical protein IJK42_08530 [Prevotella sp.]|nr:hypothetical protein [Prevotella sp.]